MKLLLTALLFLGFILEEMAYSSVGKWESLADHYKQALLSIPETERPQTRSQLKDYINRKSHALIAKHNNEEGLDLAIARFYSELQQSTNTEAKEVIPSILKFGPSLDELLFLINYYEIRSSSIIEKNFMAVVESYQITTLMEIYLLTEVVNQTHDLLKKVSLLPLFPEENWNLYGPVKRYFKVLALFPHIFQLSSFENYNNLIEYGNNPLIIAQSAREGRSFSSRVGFSLLGYSRIDENAFNPSRFNLLKNTENTIVPKDYQYYTMRDKEYKESIKNTISYAISNFNKIKNAMNSVISNNSDKSKKELEILLLSFKEKDKGILSIKLTNQMVSNMTSYFLKFDRLPIDEEEYKTFYNFHDIDLKRTHYTVIYEHFLIEAKRNSLVLKSKARLSALSISQINFIRGASINSSACHSGILAFF